MFIRLQVVFNSQPNWPNLTYVRKLLFDNLFFIIMQGPYTLIFYIKILLCFSLKAVQRPIQRRRFLKGLKYCLFCYEIVNEDIFIIFQCIIKYFLFMPVVNRYLLFSFFRLCSCAVEACSCQLMGKTIPLCGLGFSCPASFRI